MTTSTSTKGTCQLVGFLKSAPQESTTPKSVQTLFEESLSDLKLLSLPQPGLFLSIDQPLNTPHAVIIPNLQLDLGKTLIQLSTDDNDETESADFYDEEDKIGLTKNVTKNSDDEESTFFCKWLRCLGKICYEYLQNLVHIFPTFDGVEDSFYATERDSIEDSWSVASPRGVFSPSRIKTGSDDDGLTSDPYLKRKRNRGKLVIGLDLMAVICLEEESVTTYQNRYTAFVRCGQNPRRGWAPWVHFTPCDQGAPLVNFSNFFEDNKGFLLKLEFFINSRTNHRIASEILTSCTEFF